METVIPGLHASAPEPLSFAPDTLIRAFVLSRVLSRKDGNLLVYSNGAVAADDQAIENLGGISRHYLNHRHEAAFGCEEIAAAFHAPLHCHENERRSVSAKCEVSETFTKRHMLDDDFEIIPTPGHTSGATAYLWNSGEHRCLLTGDTIYLSKDGWVAALLGSSDRTAYIEKPRTHPRPRFRRARSLGGPGRPAFPCPYQQDGRATPHRRDHRSPARRRRSLTEPSTGET